MQVESEFKIQQLLAAWQRSFLTGRAGQSFQQQQTGAPAPEQGPEVGEQIPEGQQAPQVQEVSDGANRRVPQIDPTGT